LKMMWSSLRTRGTYWFLAVVATEFAVLTQLYTSGTSLVLQTEGPFIDRHITWRIRRTPFRSFHSGEGAGDARRYVSIAGNNWRAGRH